MGDVVVKSLVVEEAVMVLCRVVSNGRERVRAVGTL